MLITIAITPQSLDVIAPLFFHGAYSILRRYRNPLKCKSGCLHLPDCRFYRKTIGDRRQIASSVTENETPEDFSYYYIYTGFGSIFLTALPAFFGLSCAHFSRGIRQSFESCICKHSKNCPLGKELVVPPLGKENWVFREGGFERPDGKVWVSGVKIHASSARVVRHQKMNFKHGRGS